MTTVNSVLSAPYDSSLHDIRPETITRFIIDATRPDAISGNNCENSHNKLALVFLNEMINNSSNKELCKLLARELITLEVNVIQQQEFKRELVQLCDKLILNKFDPKTVKYIIEFKDMLDGVFNPAGKRTNDDLESDDEDEQEQDANHTETNVETESTDPLPEDNTGIKNSRAVCRKERSVVSATSINLENETNNTTLNVSSTMPTTFGSGNITNHRFLRKSLNLSRNNSIESNDAQSNEYITRPNKIRIEARIDSDKKSKDMTKSSECNNSRSRRSLRYSKRCKNNDEVEKALTYPKLREPEIIEKILTSPLKYKTLPKPGNAFLENEKGVDKNFASNFQMQHESRSEDEHTHNKAADTSAEKLNVSEVIPESPIHDSRIAFLGTTTRLRSNSSMLLMRNHAFRKVSQHSDKTTETSSTPLRNGRKRVLQTSPKTSSAASTAMSSPIRKQPCIEIDNAETSRSKPTFPRSTYKLGLEKSSQHIITRKMSSAALKRSSKNLDHMKTSTTSATQCVKNPASNKENDLLKRNSISNNKKSITNIGQDYSKKPPLKTEPHQIKSVSTRNSAKKELMSKIIMTRKRLSQENLSIELPYLKRSVKLSSAKSRIPAKSKRIEKKTSPKNQNSASVKISSVKSSRLKRVSHTSSLKPSSSSPLISASSVRLTRRRNI